MTRRHIPIRWQMTAVTFSLIVLTLISASAIILQNFIHTREDQLKTQALVTARTVAELSIVKENVEDFSVGKKILPPIVEKIRSVHKATYIVIVDINGKRLTHPIPSKIGTYSKGRDEDQALMEQTITSKGSGAQGVVMRALVPIMNKDHRQVGIVISGFTVPSLTDMILDYRDNITLTLSFTLLIGLFGSLLLANRFKIQLLNLEPYEIAQLVVERTETFNSMNEGIIAIDRQKRVTIFNKKAQDILHVDSNPIGLLLSEAITHPKLRTFFQNEGAIYQKEIKVQGGTVLASRIPIQVQDEIVGTVLIFQDITEVKQLAEELTGVKEFVSALRVQNHEHQNKLHTIAGLLQLGHQEKALDYLFTITEQHEELTRFLSSNIQNESISGLLYSKVMRGKELDINVTIDKYCYFSEFPPGLDQHDFVLIIGNLIENSFDELQQCNHSDKEIFVSITEQASDLVMIVEDNGRGIPDDIREKIFQYSFSTKEGVRGIGLHLVEQIIAKGNGTIDIDSSPMMGTSFTIRFPYEIEEQG